MMLMRLACLLTALLLAAPVFAADDADEHASHHPAAAADDGAGQRDSKADPAVRLQKNMQAMEVLMAKIRETADAAEKKRLLGLHMQAMQEQIQTIRTVNAKSGAHEHGEAGKADGGKESEHKDSDGKGGDSKQGGMMGERGMMGGGMMMKKMHKQMEQRMDALEQLLQQLIEHEAAEENVKGE